MADDQKDKIEEELFDLDTEIEKAVANIPGYRPPTPGSYEHELKRLEEAIHAEMGVDENKAPPPLTYIATPKAVLAKIQQQKQQKRITETQAKLTELFGEDPGPSTSRDSRTQATFGSARMPTRPVKPPPGTEKKKSSVKIISVVPTITDYRPIQ